MKNQKGFFEGRETRKLFYQYWTPDSHSEKPHLVILHGLGMHSHRIEVIAKFFTEKGYSLFSFDVRGHWMNIREIPGHIETMDHVQKDLILFLDVVLKEGGKKPIFLAGHDLGGLICLNYAISHPGLRGVIVSSPLLGFNSDISFKSMPSSIAAKLNPLKIIEFEIDKNKLTSDIKILRNYIADKHKTTQITYTTYSEIQSSMKRAMKKASDLTCPVLIMQAGNDKVIDKKKTINFFYNIKSQDKTYKEYPGFLHDLWHEKGRALVFRDMYVWLEKHI
jgi:alpha-beta hydrolase superfamily lysophospholipase